MKKIPTVFERDPDTKLVTERVTPGCEWVLAGEGVPTRKFDGTCCMLDEAGAWWARRQVKPGKWPPEVFVPVEHDEATGKTFGWEPMEQSSFAKAHAEALGLRLGMVPPGTYELIGPKINGDPERWGEHNLVAHGQWVFEERDEDADPQALIAICRANGWEGVVWYHADGRMAKLKVRDFGGPR